MDVQLNIFGRAGTQSKEIEAHFDTMKKEALLAYEYHAIDVVKLGLIIDNIVELEHELSHVATRINMRREETINILIEAGICGD